MSSFSKPETLSTDRQGHLCVPVAPSDLLVRFSALLPRYGLALDVACGGGRNTLFLARHGLIAAGIDRSRESLAEGRAAAAGLNLKAAFVQADLTRFTLPVEAFSVIICFKYRDPALYPSMRSALRAGGLVIYETYTAEHRAFGLKPQNPAHLLERNELRQAFGNWEIIFYRERWLDCGIASLVARKPL